MRQFRDLLTLTGRDRESLVQAAKMAGAAVLAWVVAREIYEPQSWIAPYAAVFMMGSTVFRSLNDAALQMITMVLGVLVAFVAVLVIPWPPVTLAVVVFAGMLIGRWHRLGSDGIWVAVVALLMVTFGTADDLEYLLARIGEGLLGSMIGVAVNALVFPPMRLREEDQAVTSAAGEIAELVRGMAERLRDGWDQQTARQWHRDAAALESAVRQAEDAAWRGQESTWFNPRALRRTYQPQESVLGALYEVTEQVRHMAKTFVLAEEPTVPRTGPVFDRTFADLLDDLASAVDDYRVPRAERTVDRDTPRVALERARESRAALARKRPWPDHVPPADWSAHAALVLAAERALQTLLDA